MDFPVEYMFKEVPADVDPDADPVSVVLGEMDHFGIEKAMVGVSLDRTVSTRALTEHPDRFFGSYEVNPNLGMEGVRNLVRAYERSEEHTSELQSLMRISYAVFCLKKKQT